MIFLVLIILANALILSRLNFLPYPELFVYPYLTNHGLIPYKDILDQHFPGFMFFPVNLGSLGMNAPEIARLWQYGVVILTHILLYLVAKKLVGAKKAVLANVFYALWQPFFEGWVLWIDSFLPILTLSSFYFLKSRKFFWSGLFLGLALLFKQVMIPLIVLVSLYLLFKERKFKTLVVFGLGVLIPVLLLALYITSLGIWKDFIFWTITFNLTTFAEMGRKYGTLTEIARVLGVYGFGLFAFFDKKYRDTVILLAVFLIGSLATIFARFDFVHLQPSLPFIALLSGISAFWLFKQKYPKVLVFLYALALSFLLFQFYRGHWGDRVFFFGEEEKRVVSEVQKLSAPDEKIFTLGTLPHMYQMADRLPSGNVFVFQFPWFMIEAEDRVLAGLMNDPPKVVIRDLTAEVEDQNLVSFMPRIGEYISRNYKVVNKIGGIEIMVAK